MRLSQRIKKMLSQPRLVVNLLLLTGFSAFWIRDFLYWLPKDMYETSLNYWAYTDWLIDYSQGFIRRGLSGDMWRLIPPSVTPLHFVAVFSWVLILAVVFGYVRLLMRSCKTMHPLTLFGLLFLPSLFVFYLHDHNTIARKEILGYITVLLHLLVIEKSFPIGDGSALPVGNLRRYVKWLLPITLLLLPAIILVHEGNFLLFIPLHGMITLSIFRMKTESKFLQSALWTGMLYLPALIAFVAVYLSGTPDYQVLLGICEKWLGVGAIREGTCVLPPDRNTGTTLPGSFAPMQWTRLRATEITVYIIFSNWKAWVAILPTLGIIIWYLGRQALYAILRSRFAQSFSPRAARRYSGLFFVKYFIFPFLVSLLVYFNAYDYGRWFTVACINFSMLAVSINLPNWEFVNYKKKTEEESVAADTPEHLDHRLVFYGVSIIICVLALVLWLPHYCLFSCEIIRSPLEFFSHTFMAN
ncbi:MAG: hypothetical protein JEZ00_11885 [Anaerolineaceae bacterium]|nr:hypothetical protein [Anaerolineaceae bacterium]